MLHSRSQNTLCIASIQKRPTDEVAGDIQYLLQEFTKLNDRLTKIEDTAIFEGNGYFKSAIFKPLTSVLYRFMYNEPEKR